MFITEERRFIINMGPQGAVTATEAEAMAIYQALKERLGMGLGGTTVPTGRYNWMVLAIQGDKLAAIKALRAQRNLGGLKEAKDSVEWFLNHLFEHEDRCMASVKAGLGPRQPVVPEMPYKLPGSSDEPEADEHDW